jgi:DNA invertase Pin-like site-specific DNA recombinase
LVQATKAQAVLELAVVVLDGLITNGKFCCTRRVRLGLTWWHRPLRLRRSGLQTDAVLVGEPYAPDLDRLPPVQPRHDGDRRWDQAYQLLVRWTAAQDDDTRPVGPRAQEVPDGCRGVRAGLDYPPSPGADIEQQLDRLVAAVTERGWTLDERHVYRDDGYSGASLGRPGLDCLRDHAALAEVDLVVVTAPDRLARNYVHQVLLIDELGRHGCQVEFLDRPMSQDPHDQLLLQIRGAVAEYERTLIAERMRRGRQAKLRAGTLLPWTTPPFGYRLDPERPRDAAGVRVEPDTAVLVAQRFDWYLEPQATVYRLAKRLTDLHVATPTGKPRWNAASVRGILRNPAYAGRAQTNRTRVVPARRRKSALLPVGPGHSHAPRPPRTGSRWRSRRW